MTKRNCYLTDVGNAIEKLADALDPERTKPFSGDILDLLEWAERDALAMRAEIATVKAEKFKAGNNQTIFVVRISELRQQLAEALSTCKVKDELIKKFRRAIGDHYAPDDCYATGPLTGNDFLDLVQCPACSAIAAYEEALDATKEK